MLKGGPVHDDLPVQLTDLDHLQTSTCLSMRCAPVQKRIWTLRKSEKMHFRIMVMVAHLCASCLRRQGAVGATKISKDLSEFATVLGGIVSRQLTSKAHGELPQRNLHHEAPSEKTLHLGVAGLRDGSRQQPCALPIDDLHLNVEQPAWTTKC